MAVIDRDYWLEFAKNGVSNSIASRENAAEKLDSFLTWIWSIYTGVFALASLFSFVSSDIWQLIWVAQPVLVIMLARYFCTIVSMPSANNDAQTSADPNDVASIIDSFILIVADKKKKLKVAKIFTLISICSLTAALVGYNYCDPNKELKQDIQIQKLKKELNENDVAKVNPQTAINDSIEALNKYYDHRIEYLIKQKKLECVEKGDAKCLDSLNKLSQ